MSDPLRAITHPLLTELGVTHGFGVRGAAAPPGVLRPEQVHGAAVARVVSADRLVPDVADAVVSSRRGVAIAVVTADCVPVLAASRNARAVAAIHAGWRGLAAGVIEAGLGALSRLAPGAPQGCVAVIGPHIGPCCYEVDEPVLSAARARFGEALDDYIRPTSAAHAQIDLGGLTALARRRCGIEPANQAILPEPCTFCDADRFHSYRRDGDRAGRLLHHIRPLEP
jgi:YfiH family protein